MYYAKRIQEIPKENDGFELPPAYFAKSNKLLREGKYLNGLYGEALKAFIDGLTALPSPQNDSLVNSLKLGLGNVYVQKEMVEKADDLFMELATVNEDNPLAAEANLFLGVVFSAGQIR